MFFDQRKPHFCVGTILKKKKIQTNENSKISQKFPKNCKKLKIRKRKKSNFCLTFCVENSIIFHRKKLKWKILEAIFF